MVKLERIIRQVLSEERKKTEMQARLKEEHAALESKKQEYDSEFNLVYENIESIRQIENRFINWANGCTIEDNNNKVKDGKGFYGSLLEEARGNYYSNREEGYEIQRAFDIATDVLIEWIQRSAEKKACVIYLNYSREFLRRMRKASW